MSTRPNRSLPILGHDHRSGCADEAAAALKPDPYVGERGAKIVSNVVADPCQSLDEHLHLTEQYASR